MEKKTIGKFISVLRRANGMTQRELAEKLYVSDKTVSRWECDECAPDLALIPAIAEIFGITADELLRGERANIAETEAVETTKQKAKSDKQFKAMLYNRTVKYKNLTLISVGLIALALVAALIFNLGFLKGIVGCCVASVFLIASIICQISFATSARLPISEDEMAFEEEIKKANSDIVKKELSVIFGAIIMFAFILPIAFVGSSFAGLGLGSWLLVGGAFALIVLILGHILCVFGIRKSLVGKEILHCDENGMKKLKYQSRLLKRALAVAVCIIAVLIVGVVILNSIGAAAFAKRVVFTDDDDWKSFKEFMRNGRIYSDSESSFFVDAFEEPVYGIEGENHPMYQTDYLYDKDGNEYIQFEYRDRFYVSIEYLEFNEDGTPAEVGIYTRQTMSNARRIFSFLNVSLYALMGISTAICAAVYVSKLSKLK